MTLPLLEHAIERPRLVIEQADAVAWLRPENPDFIIVCERAGFDPEAFIERYRDFELARTLRLGYGAVT